MKTVQYGGFKIDKNPDNLNTSFVSFSLFPYLHPERTKPRRRQLSPPWLERISSLYLVIQTLFALGFLSVDLHYNV